MSRWMSKSIVHVVHENGDRIKMDDYIHKSVHLIVGALASEMYPEQWDQEAKPVKKEEDEAAELDEDELLEDDFAEGREGEEQEDSETLNEGNEGVETEEEGQRRPEG